MTIELAQARAEQARCAAILQAHPDWRDSDELVDIPGHGRMKARTAYAGALAGCLNWLGEEVLILREGRHE